MRLNYNLNVLPISSSIFSSDFFIVYETFTFTPHPHRVDLKYRRMGQKSH